MTRSRPMGRDQPSRRPQHQGRPVLSAPARRAQPLRSPPPPLPAPGVARLRTLRPARLRIPARRFTAGIAALPPTASEALETELNAEEAVAYNRSRVATATAVALYRSDYVLPMPDGHLDDAVHALDFPYSMPSPETRAAIRATLAVLEADYTVTVTQPPALTSGPSATGGPRRKET
ncbi:hypothetical protein [Streptomyces sp. NPDC003996]